MFEDTYRFTTVFTVANFLIVLIASVRTFPPCGEEEAEAREAGAGQVPAMVAVGALHSRLPRAFPPRPRPGMPGMRGRPVETARVYDHSSRFVQLPPSRPVTVQSIV